MQFRLGPSLNFASAAFLFASGVWAQDPPPVDAPPADAGASSAPAAAEPLPAPAAPAASEPMALPAPAAEPEETFPPAWFRIDSDGAELQLWAGATHPLSETVGLATDMYVNSGTLGEFDIGPAFTLGDFVLTPMVGVQFDWGQKKAAAIVPQLYLVGGPDPIYMELWVQNYLYTPFDYEVDGVDATNTLYARLFVDYEISKYLAVGPQVEPLLALNGDGDTLVSLPVGASVVLSNYGVGNSLFIFLGYETKEEARVNDAGLAGRLSFVKNF